jgi:hypothetical protein
MSCDILVEKFVVIFNIFKEQNVVAYCKINQIN